MAEGEEEFVLPTKKTWIDVQKKTFTGWCNSFLSERLLKIDDLETDCRSGILLINLLEEISGKQIPHNKRAKLRVQQAENNNMALGFLKSEGIKLVAIGAEDIVDGKLKLILGLIWTLILRYQIQQGVGEGSPKAELLAWVNAQIEPYGQHAKNFTNDWKDGVILSALCDSLEPGTLLKDKNLSSLSGDPLTDVNKAMDAAEEHYEIPKILDPQDMVELPEELSVITYVSYYRDWLEKADERRKRREEEERLRLLRTAFPANSFAFGPGIEDGNNTYEESKFAIQAVNVHGDTLTHGGETTWKVNIKSSSGESIDAKWTDAGDGTYPVTYSAKIPGEYQIDCFYGDTPIKNSPYKVKVIGADAGNSEATGPGLEGGNVDKPAEFKILAKDAKGNICPAGGDNFKVLVKSPNGKESEPSVKDKGDGTYDVSYDPKERGNYEVKISLRGDELKDSPFKVLVQAGVADKSYAEGPGLEGAQNLHAANFTIFSVDVDGKQRPNGGDPFEVSIEGPGNDKVKSDIKDNNDGTYSVSYTTSKAGDHKIDVQLYDNSIKDMPKTVSVISCPNSDNSYAKGPGLEEGNQTLHETQFTIFAVDMDGSQRNAGGDVFDVSITGAEKITPDVVDKGDGTYDVSYTATKPGDYEINVSYEGDAIKDMPKKLNIRPCPNSSSSYAEGPGLEKPQTHHKQDFTIHAVDADGSDRKTGGDQFDVSIDGPEKLTPEVTDNNDGTYSVSYQPIKAGDYNIDVQYEDSSIKDLPKKVFVKAAPNAENCYAEGPGLDEGVKDNEETSFTIHAIDHEGKPREDGGDKFDVKISGVEDVPVQVTDNGDGTYTVKYSPDKVGDYVVDVSYEGAQIKDSPYKVKVVEGTDADNSVVGIFSIGVQARDKHGENKTFGGDKFEVNVVPANDEAEVEVDAKDNGDGSYVASYSIKGKGKYRVDVKLNGKHISGSPFRQNNKEK